MNDNLVISFPVAADLSSNKEHLRVKITSTGINLAASTEAAIGTLRRGNAAPAVGQSAVGMACAVQLFGNVHDVRVGNSSAAIAIGAELIPDAANPGYYVPGTGAGTVFASQGITGFHGAIIQAIKIYRDIA